MFHVPSAFRIQVSLSVSIVFSFSFVAIYLVWLLAFRQTETIFAYHYLSVFSLHFLLHSAESWSLTKPLQCVSMRLERRGSALLLIFTYTQDSHKGGKSRLFALCTINLVDKGQPLEHYVEAVLDSTRYFVVRVTDEKAGREASIGLGFRERQEAGDFRAALAKYETEIAKERSQRAMKMSGHG